MLAAFLVSFLFIRTSARLIRSPKVPWWPGSVKTTSGLHLHHLVWGIVLLLLTGFLGFATWVREPWNDILAVAFGIGAGLTLDEFALWIHLRDVYWAEEGRASFDAFVVAALLGGLIVIGVSPFDLPNDGASVATVAVAVLVAVLLSSPAILKGKLLTGLVGIFVPVISLVGVARLAAPDSWWARRRYDPAGRKMARAKMRWERIRARRRRLADAIARSRHSDRLAPASPVGRTGHDEPSRTNPASRGSCCPSRNYPGQQVPLGGASVSPSVPYAVLSEAAALKDHQPPSASASARSEAFSYGRAVIRSGSPRTRFPAPTRGSLFSVLSVFCARVVGWVSRGEPRLFVDYDPSVATRGWARGVLQ